MFEMVKRVSLCGGMECKLGFFNARTIKKATNPRFYGNVDIDPSAIH